jgi:2-(1,2-epoxy-1,2-dihydrophenyl)acetyl-CoA isomerase
MPCTKEFSEMGSEHPLVTCELDSGVATIRLNRPDAGNALSASLAEQLFEHVQDVAGNPLVRCVLVTAAGRFFCVGGDVKGMQQAGARVGELVDDLTRPLHGAIGLLLRMDKPLVVAVNGPVAGGGLGLALTGDIVLAAASAHFSMAYSGIGFSPDGATTWLLPRLVGLRLAQEMALTNRRLSSHEAVSSGLVTRLVADEALADEALRIARQLAGGPVAAFAATRRLLLASDLASPEVQMKAEAQSVRRQAEGPEGKEGLTAFMEKRVADFAGIA